MASAKYSFSSSDYTLKTTTKDLRPQRQLNTLYFISAGVSALPMQDAVRSQLRAQPAAQRALTIVQQAREEQTPPVAQENMGLCEVAGAVALFQCSHRLGRSV